MKRLQNCLLVAAVFSAMAVLASCDMIPSQIPEAPDGWKPLTTDELQQEYDSARAIVDTRTRDNAMKRVAVDAADSNFPDFSIKAVNAITSQVERNSAAGYCADRFDQLGNRDLADRFVGMVSDIHLRDKLNKQLASHPPGTDLSRSEMPATQP